ncbi:Protein disulfide-isomerase [Colletotrichum orbiculare MAFF 240422]|uniref:Protein disulfide-isomerase n=1 Tax=Colletotrichum orbiculare (strain 104-T / ATCC 96160 / CBS 514.97 / LARS 414 / MAFF 240422) TaxID=1213857 RepID=N4V1F0_COLOR|nr:Protein disulfide-isomerase [Colletotrichum orbiculare MAFF 240422]
MFLWRTVGYVASFAVAVRAWTHASRSELDQALRTRDDTLVAFVDPESGNSQLLETDWTTIAKSDRRLLSIDCTYETKLCLDQDVRSFPAIRLYHSAKTFDYYRGPRKAAEISAFLGRSKRPVVSTLGLDNATSFAIIDTFVFILHLTEQDGGKGLYRQFHDVAVANAHRCSFGVVLLQGEHASSYLHCYNNLDGLTSSTGNFYSDPKSLDHFLKLCTARLVPEMTRLTRTEFTMSASDVLYFFDTDPVRREQFAAGIKDVAKKHRFTLRVVTADPMMFPDLPGKLGLEWIFPAISYQHAETELMYPSLPTDIITPEFVAHFIDTVKDGSALPAFQTATPTAEEEEDGWEVPLKGIRREDKLRNGHKDGTHDEL